MLRAPARPPRVALALPLGRALPLASGVGGDGGDGLLGILALGVRLAGGLLLAVGLGGGLGLVVCPLACSSLQCLSSPEPGVRDAS